MEDSESVLRQDELPLPEHCRVHLGMITMDLQHAISTGKERPVALHVVAPDTVGVFVVVDMEDDAQKEELVGMVRKEAAKRNADMVLMVSEGWARPPTPPGRTYEDMLAEYGAVEHMPGVVEVVMVYIETPTHAYMAHTPITGEGLARRHAELAFHSVAKDDPFYAEMDQGTFCRLLPSAERKAAITDCLARVARVFQNVGADPHFDMGTGSSLSMIEDKLWSQTHWVMSDEQAMVGAVLAKRIQAKRRA